MSIVILKLPGCPSKDEILAKRKLNLAQMHLAIRAKKRKVQTGGNPASGTNVPNPIPGGNQVNIVPNKAGGAPQNNRIQVVPKAPVISTVRVLRKPNPFLVYFVQYWKVYI